MRSDLYTRVVLTIIAGCLLALVAKPVFEVRPAVAANQAVDVNIVAIAGAPIKTKAIGGAEGALPITTGVNMIGSEVPISVAPSR